MALLSVEGRCDSDAGILVGMPFEGRHCETIGQIHQVCRAEFPHDRLVRRPCTLPGGQRCAPGVPSDHSRAPIASEGANRPATGLQTCTRQRGHRPQPSQVRRKPVPASCGSAPTGLRHGRDTASVPRHGPLGSTPAAGGAARLSREPVETRPATPATAPGP